MMPPLHAFEENSWDRHYQECIEGNCENGYGTMRYYSTQKYVGEFKNGKRHGQGTLYLTLGTVLKGTWKNDQIVEGTATFPDGKQYTGTWEFGYRHGKGEMIYPDGRVYTGEFKEGKRTGYGTMVLLDGREKTGVFLNGKYVGSDR